MNENRLDQMPLDQLIELKGRIENIIQARIETESEAFRRELDAVLAYESMIAKLHNELIAPILRTP